MASIITAGGRSAGHEPGHAERHAGRRHETAHEIAFAQEMGAHECGEEDRDLARGRDQAHRGEDHGGEHENVGKGRQERDGDDGAALPQGVYFFRLVSPSGTSGAASRAAGEARAGRLTLLR